VIEPSPQSPLDQDRDPEPTAPGRPSADLVEDVLGSMADLDERPVSEHVSVFEEAHDRLRDALARAGDDNRAS
jgi:hypothetical protein